MAEACFVVQLRGLPWTATVDDVSMFLAGCDIKGGRHVGIHLIQQSGGRASGQCYVELLTSQDLTTALTKNNKYMGHRYIEVFQLEEQEFKEQMEKASQAEYNKNNSDSHIVKCRGLPWSAKSEDLSVFFSGCDIKGGKSAGVHFLKNDEGRPSGEAFVEFMSVADKLRAMEKNRQHMGRRYVEVFDASTEDMEKSLSDMQEALNNSEPIVYLRGLPYRSTEDTVRDFFEGLKIAEIQLVLASDQSETTGECYVQFDSYEDCEAALKYSEKMIGTRYIEVFQSSRRHWRSGPRELEPVRSAPSSRGGGERRGRGSRAGPYDRDYDRDSRGGREREGGRRSLMKGVSGYGAEQSAAAYGNGAYDQYSGAAGVQGYSHGGYNDLGGYQSAGMPGKVEAVDPGKHCVVMSGVDISTSVGDVIKFFANVVQPKNVEVKYDGGSGSVVVDFYTHADAMKAMLRDKEQLGNTLVELQLKSKPEDYQTSLPMQAAPKSTYSQAYTTGGW